MLTTNMIDRRIRCEFGGGAPAAPKPPAPPTPDQAAQDVMNEQVVQGKKQKQMGFASTILTAGQQQSSQAKTLLGG